MIIKITTSVNDEKVSQIIEWDENQDDFIINGINGLTRFELIEFVEEMKRLTEWVE